MTSAEEGSDRYLSLRGFCFARNVLAATVAASDMARVVGISVDLFRVGCWRYDGESEIKMGRVDVMTLEVTIEPNSFITAK